MENNRLSAARGIFRLVENRLYLNVFYFFSMNEILKLLNSMIVEYNNMLSVNHLSEFLFVMIYNFCLNARQLMISR